MTIRKVRYIVFLRDVFWATISCFGGVQAHIGVFLKIFVEKKKYLNEDELMELSALCQVLPGPTSTQTITAIGFRIGGSNLAYLTLFIWCLPAVSSMIAFAYMVDQMNESGLNISFARYLHPMSVSFVAYAAYQISYKVVKSYTGLFIMIAAAVGGYFIQTPYLFPVLLLLGGLITAKNHKKHKKAKLLSPLKVEWSNFLLWAGIWIVVAFIGAISNWYPIKLFENFYRNGSLIFGGGQVLVPYMNTEFVQFKNYLSSKEFTSGYGFVQAIPGPTFSFASYVGALSMRQGENYNLILGGIVASLGIFLPGTFMIFFVIRFWDRLKCYPVVKASLEGIAAVGAGLVCSAVLVLYQPVELSSINNVILIGSLGLLIWNKIPPPFIIGIGLLLGVII